MRAFVKNDWAGRHGPPGHLLASVRRWGYAGWLLSAVLALSLAGVALSERINPPPLLLVDGSGRIVGHVTWSTMSDDQTLREGAMRFVEAYLSMNSATVFDEYSHAVNMLSAPLRTQVLARVRQSGYLSRIAAAHLWSWVVCDAASPVIRQRSATGLVLEVRGEVVTIGRSHRARVPFDLMLTVVPVARTPDNPYGTEIEAIRAL